MKIKILALDMDGTLLTSDKKISPLTADAIKRASKKGIIVTLSTGRPVQGLNQYESIIIPDVPVITYNGAMIITLHNRKVLFHKTIDIAAAEEVMKLAEKFNTTLVVWSDNKLYVNRIDKRVEQYKLLSGMEPIVINNFTDLLTAGITKILWLDEAEKHIEYQHYMDKNLINKKIVYCTSHPTFLEFMAEGISKASAMEELGKVLGIKQSEMAAAGDGYNDISMIEYSGLGVAMENAPDEVKEKADYITAGNDNEGISKLIDKIIADNENLH